MSIRKLKLLPGVNVEQTPTLNQANFAQTTHCRFYNGLIQKRGGWQAMTSTPLIGTCSGLHGWADIMGNTYLAAGTEQRLEVLIGGTLNDITPLAQTDNPTVAVSTTATSSTVTIQDTGYAPNVGDWINLITPVSVGGVVLQGFYRVTAIPSANQFSFIAAKAATSTVTLGGAVPEYTTTNGSGTVKVTLNNHGYSTGSVYTATISTTVATLVIFGPYSVGTVIDANNFDISLSSGTANANTTAFMNSGNMRIEYLIPSGFAANTVESGYGAGLYGAGLYGGSSGQAISVGRQWSLDNFGQDLIASPTNGKIYYWQPATVQPAVVVSNTAPIHNTDVFVVSQAEIIMALGAETGGTQEPLLVRWCDAGDFTDWTTSATNQAGSYSIPQGSKLVGGLALGLNVFLWTDIGLTIANYLGFPLVWGFNPVAVGCGLINKRAKAAIGSMVVWLSQGSFFTMTVGGGAPSPIECPVWDIMYDNADFTQPGLFVMGANSLNNEFELHFPLSTSSPYYVAGSVTRGSVKWNFVENVWDYTISSQLQRTAWEAQSPVGNPVGADLAGLLQQHEIGFDANGAAMLWSWQTGYFDIPDGEEFVFVDWLIPDFVMEGNVTISLNVTALTEPNATPISAGPFPIMSTTQYVPPFGIRGRQFAISAYGQDTGTFNRLGAVRYRFAPDGRGY